MKIFIFFLFLIFTSNLNAEEISDYDIEGFRIGDSLLSHFKKNEIENFRNYDDLPSSMKFRISYFDSTEFNLKIYDGVQFYIKPEDKNYKIHGINGNIRCSNKIDCEEILNDILTDLTSMFNKSYITDGKIHKHQDDPSGKSTYKSFYFQLSSGYIIIQHIDWSNEVPWHDHVRLGINTNEVVNWINNNYY